MYPLKHFAEHILPTLHIIYCTSVCHVLLVLTHFRSNVVSSPRQIRANCWKTERLKSLPKFSTGQRPLPCSVCEPHSRFHNNQILYHTFNNNNTVIHKSRHFPVNNISNKYYFTIIFSQILFLNYFIVVVVVVVNQYPSLFEKGGQQLLSLIP